MTGLSYGTAFAHWREGCGDGWRAYTHHAFVEGLGHGSLPRAAFLHYLVQDYLFLVHFARAWSLGVVKAGTLDEMKTCAGTVDALVNHEMSLHVKICAEAGIDEATLFAATEEIENVAYTRYVMDAGLQGDFLDLMATLAPCCFGYGEIGARLAGSADAHTPYRDWIETYADEDYQGVMASVGQMIDGAVMRRLGPDFATSARWPALQDRFATATRLEVAFWDMGLRGA
ncbi:thiaminase II [Sulfitobacter pseudonitzschiae]|uniref:Aminopyrimidine aminohydrolase n=1 Tax=Pseudosulfitobacter pseudonitzschiae TaxID=1402135 RepID=A0A9Q2NPE0_9RHOB|nr:thiaminase II [Pseudosulfitobacter pseudonitzschiae]MBM2294380.1 thiaminase II [Pseudosulfitobacter pseudonitzschiae]MBM2299305.1 thiaminase II [Pseudosulfitobacter pseudonitzschiae]MBM2304212.1 thiaminase II [Pseudosulfitobacter pseudonitzschiae]MBM2313992.1 thiaminase II [Pseudosulfitobacter pseudonitzschiae]MBM2318907.1 thiaminase II [Pseudosulfitobacter pseudonitzschiae]